MKLKTTASALLLAFLSGCTGYIGTEHVPSPAPTPTSTNPCPFDVVRGTPNSWLLSSVEMHFIYWGNYPEDKKPVYQAEWDNLLNHGTVLQRLAEYGIHGGSLDTNYYTLNPDDVLPNADGGAPTNTVLDSGLVLLDDSQIVTQLNNDIQLGYLPYPNDNTLYMIMLPPGTLTAGQLKYDEGGYHAAGMYGTQPYAYALISNHGDDITFTNLIISHELGEAATDPGKGGWRDYTAGHGSPEIGDLCTYIPVPVDGYVVQKFWSEGACQCL